MREKMNTKPLTARDRLIVALDVDSAEQARAIVNRLGETVTFYKVGLQLFFRTHFAFVKELQGLGKRVFLDLKIEDIPTTLQLTIKDHPEVDMIELMTLTGASQLAAAAKSAGNRNTKFLMLTVLSSFGDEDIREFYGSKASVDKIVKLRTQKAIEAGCDGVIASGNTVYKIRHEWFPRDRYPDLLIVAPGIRPANSPKNDHKRTLTPGQAIRFGADQIVVGRPITHQSPERQKQAAEEIIEEIANALEGDSAAGEPSCRVLGPEHESRSRAP